MTAPFFAQQSDLLAQSLVSQSRCRAQGNARCDALHRCYIWHSVASGLVSIGAGYRFQAHARS